MLARSERQSPIAAVGGTPDAVGPGSYSLPSSVKRTPRPSAAFAWAGQRSFALQPPSCDSDSADDADTAGATGSPQQAPAPWANKQSASFASSTQRFTLDREAGLKPG